MRTRANAHVRRIAAALLLSAVAASAKAAPAKLHVGDAFAIHRDKEMSKADDNGSTSSSTDRDVIVERVIAIRDDGMELEYDQPKTTSSEDRARQWQLPVRIFRPDQGAPRLLNRAELEQRRDGWLKAANLSQDLCGRLYFTWNAFRIECDPQSALQIVAAFDLGPDNPREGSAYRDEEARGEAPLRRAPRADGGATFLVELPIDAETVSRARAETDVGVAELMKKPLSLEAALRARAGDEVSGSLSISLEADSSGHVSRKTRVAKIRTRRGNGVVENETVSIVLERRSVGDDKP